LLHETDKKADRGYNYSSFFICDTKNVSMKMGQARGK